MVLCQSHCQQGWCNRCFVWFNVLFSTFSHAFYTSLWLVSSQMKRRVLVWKRLRQWSRWGFVACFVTMPRWDSGVAGVLWHVLSPCQDETVESLGCCGMSWNHGKMTEHVKFGALHAFFAISTWFAITWGQNMPKLWLWWHFSFWGEWWGAGGRTGQAVSLLKLIA